MNIQNEEILPLLQRLDVVCQEAQDWWASKQQQPLEQTYQQIPARWLCWLYRHAAYAPLEGTDRIIRILLTLQPGLPADLQKELQTKKFPFQQWPAQLAWEKQVKAYNFKDRKLVRFLLNLSQPTRSNAWALFELSVLLLGEDAFSAESRAALERFEQCFYREYPCSELIERLQRAAVEKKPQE